MQKKQPSDIYLIAENLMWGTGGAISAKKISQVTGCSVRYAQKMRKKITAAVQGRYNNLVFSVHKYYSGPLKEWPRF